MAMKRVVGSTAVSEQMIGRWYRRRFLGHRRRQWRCRCWRLGTCRLERSPPVLDVARLDRLGRLSARDLVRAMGWAPGRRVTIDVVDDAVLVVSAAGGRHAVGGRGELVLPVAVRQLCGIDPFRPVLLAAYPVSDMVLIHPMEVVARLVAGLHIRLVGGQGG